VGVESSDRQRAQSLGNLALVKTPAITIVHGDVLDTLRRVRRSGVPVAAVVLDPPYNVGAGGTRPDYLPWLLRVIRASARVADHVFVWGFPPTVAAVLMRIPTSLRLKAWLTWAYTNAPTRAAGWRPAQQACLHLVRRGARQHPENFLTPAQLRLQEAGKLRYPPSPTSVIEKGLLVGWAGKAEQTGHPAQKPEKVIEPLILMSTVPGDLVVDPMAGSGTTGAVCARLGRAVLVADHDEEHVRRMERRLGCSRASSVTPSTRRRVETLPTEARRREGVRLHLEEGLSFAEAGRRLGVSRESVRRWVEAHKAGISLIARRKLGGVPKLRTGEKAALLRAGRAGKIRGSLSAVASQIEVITGIQFSRGHIPRLLAALGIERRP
jgi:transposase